MGDRLLLTVWARGALSDNNSLFEPGAPACYELGWDASDKFFVRRLSPAGPTFNKASTTIHLLGVAFVRFHAVSGVPDLALRTSSTSPIPPGEDASRWPTEPDDPGSDRSYARLARACALTGSGISIHRPGDQTASRVIFRLGLLDPLMITSSPHREVTLSEDKVREAVTAWPEGDAAEFPMLGQYGSAAEMRNVAARREPYLAGCFRLGGEEANLESFASNAVGLGVLGGVELLNNPAHFPTKDVSWGTVSAVGDGFWWAIPRRGRRSTDPRLTLSEALDSLACFPNSPNSVRHRPIVTLVADPDRKEAAQLAVLDLLGLTAAPSVAIDRADLPDCSGGPVPPYHYLHMHRPKGGGWEWRRWVKLAPPGTKNAEAGTPALVRISRSDPTAETRSDPTAEPESTVTVRVEGLTDAHILDIWSRRVAGPCRDAALRQGSSRRVSLLPDLAGHDVTQDDDLAFGGPWCAELTFAERWPDSGAPPPSKLWERYRPTCATFYPRDVPKGPRLPFWTHPAPKAPESTGAKSLAVGKSLAVAKIRLPALRAQASDASVLTFGGATNAILTVPEGGLQFGIDSEHDWSLRSAHALTLKAAPLSADGAGLARVVSFGGLDVEFGDWPPDDKPVDDCHIEIAVEPRLSHNIGRGVKERLSMPVRSVTIGGADTGNEDVADQPLVTDALNMMEEGGFLHCRDFIDSDGVRTFTLALNSAKATTASASFTLIDPSPMMVARLSVTTHARGAAFGSELATWDAADGLWRLVSDSSEQSEIKITLPPQGVAEAWERSKSATSNHLGADQIAEGGRVPARLTPVTVLRIEGDERARNAVAPWNIARTLGFSADDLPGARLKSIESIEVLYGLEGKAARIEGMRMAELSGWRGRPREPLIRVEFKRPAAADSETGRPAEPPSPSPREERAELWAKGMAAWRQRLAVLDVRDERNPLDRPRISNVSYRLRSKKKPIRAGEVEPHPNDDAKYAKPESVPDDPELWTAWEEGGILGGALAGFEQASLIATLFDDEKRGRRDGIGELDGLQLSALGAWTSPRAAFDNGLTLIAAEAAMGRVNEARFERKGRIAALHHLAKHVIVYRRAFLPSVQFHGEQDPHFGRPIVRKVEEYIEITQPVRTYPDRDTAWPIHAGPVLGARFRTVRIAVHGSWAQSLKDQRVEGYSIPLWREGLHALTYPKPAAELLVAGDPQRTDPEPPARRIDNPQSLRFYTITAIGDESPPPDVDLWPLVYGTDYIDRPLDDPRQTHRGRPLTAESFANPAQPAATLPPADLVSPGLEEFTLLLEAGPGVNVMEARNPSPMIADLRSVLMMRGRPPTEQAPRPGTPSPEPDRALAGAAYYHDIAAAQHAVADILAAVPAGKLEGDDLAKAKIRAKVALARVSEALGAGGVWITELDTVCDWAHEPAERLKALIKRLEPLSSNLGETWASNRAKALRQLEQTQSAIDALLPLSGQAERLLDPLIAEANSAQSELIAAYGDGTRKLLEGTRETVKGWSQAVSKDLRDAANTLKRDINAGKIDAQQAVAQFRATVLTVSVQVDDREHQLLAVLPKLDRTIATLRKGAPRIAKAAPKAAAGAERVADQLETLRSEMGRQAPAVGLEVRTRLAEVSSALAAWSNAVAGASAAVEDAIDALTAKLSSVAMALEAVTVAAVNHLIVPLVEDAGDRLAEMADALTLEVKAAADAVSQAVSGPLLAVEIPLRDTSSAIAHLRQAAVGTDPYLLIKVIEGLVSSTLTKLQDLEGKLTLVATEFCGLLNGASATAKALLKNWADEIKILEQAIDDANELYITVQGHVEAIELALGQIRAGVDRALDNRAITLLINTPAQAETLGEAAALSLLRAAGAPPIVESLIFNRDQIAYHFEERARVIVTPVTALVDQADRALRGVGLALPTLGIDGTLLSPASSAFKELNDEANDILKDLEMKAQDVLKDFAGLKDLLPNLKFDSDLADAVKVTHDFDAARQVAWLKAEIKFGPRTEDLFRHDAFAIVAKKMVLDGMSLYERGLDGGERRVVKASMVSDWLLIVGGMPLIQIKDAAIRYDEADGLKFDIKPRNITFPGPLRVLSNLLSDLNQGGENPLQLELVADEATGKPIGLKSRYDLPPIAINAGAVSVFNAALGVHLDLVQRSEFEIRSFAYFGRRDSPFAMTVSFLGGGGYVEAEATHLPASRKTNIALRVSIGLVAGTGFSFGPLRGSVQIYLGFEASFLSGNSGSRIAVAVIFVLSGSVTAWGFVTVDLGVRLQLAYDGKKMQGSGHVKVTVRISRFYKKSFSRPITYKLVGG